MTQEPLRIAVLGNGTTDYLVKALSQVCGEYQIETAIYQSPYQQYNQDVFDPESPLYRWEPEVCILCLEGSVLFPEWYEAKTTLESREKKLAAVQDVFESLVHLMEELHQNTRADVVVNNFKIPSFAPLGLLDNKNYPGLRDMVCLLNDKLAQWASDRAYAYIYEYRAFVSRHGDSQVEDLKMYYATKAPLSLKYTRELAKDYMRYILPRKFMTKKCLVLDLDNTLWGGIAGEDGLSGIKLDITGPGKSFYDFQKEILNLYHRGVILAISSKNNVGDVMPILEGHPHMLLKKEHFSAMKINWLDKAQNIAEMAQELNIGTDSMVFFDDNIVERELVKSLLPEVTVVNVPSDTSKYTQALRERIEFERLYMTREDLDRNTMYAGNQKRIQAQKKFGNVEDYLKSLKTKVILEFSNDFSIPRIAQMTQKTNQFNMTTRRYTKEDIIRFHNAEDYLVMTCQVTDIYGDNGITGLCIVKLEGRRAEIDTFLLSCRVMGRNVEYDFIRQIIEILREKGVESIHALYKRTQKNQANRKFYEKSGFSILSETEDEVEFRLDLSGETGQADHSFLL